MCRAQLTRLTRPPRPQTFTKEQVASHTSEKDGVWIIVEGGVYDV